MMSKPPKFLERLKYYFWRFFLFPIFPYLRNALLKMKIIFHEGRQPWHVGFLKNKSKIEDLKFFLESKGFILNRIAWVDSGEILSMRLFDGHKFQYHIRVFKDGEIRAHYEQTPEMHPFGHFFENIFEPRTNEFKKILTDWV